MAGPYFLGVDGGGTKTGFVLADEAGTIVATHQLGPSYYIQIGFDGLHELLAEGVGAVLAAVHATLQDVAYAFFGLPAYGEDSHAQAFLDVIPEAVLGHHRYRCGNDMICGWAGSLGGEDGINIVAGTGSIGYGERRGKSARGGGWGEIFSDEGSAHWVAVQGLNAFSRMGDGRLPKGPLYDVFMEAMELKIDLDICGAVFGREPPSRDKIAAMSQLVAKAVEAGDPTARGIFERAGFELAAIVDAIRQQLDCPPDERMRVSYSGGMFRTGQLILDPFSRHLRALNPAYDIVEPLHSPGVGATLYAARLNTQVLQPG
ncbi:N-acetylglucosamine kinase [Asticcacaulis sp. AC460]|uniref:N-acetylglucosamine kinase n=1 Tax=Asticcacaulis sp. AC460 TaxID=1282360 RepID=UPI0003C3AF68|nr:BadF/BadG/BcrA/BcrD ATPase family protein [Asticcacaulis sp. AC460]ESQ91101.1 N-acetylglucosamine kinase [Asticcacaulis sp. AC460]